MESLPDCFKKVRRDVGLIFHTGSKRNKGERRVSNANEASPAPGSFVGLFRSAYTAFLRVFPSANKPKSGLVMSEQPKGCLLKQFYPYRIPANHTGMPDALKRAMQCSVPTGRETAMDLVAT
jgi:hypothetical protein